MPALPGREHVAQGRQRWRGRRHPAAHVSTPTPSRRGTASRSERDPSRPAEVARSSHRTPGVSSSPSSRSRPGPTGSVSTTSAGPACPPTWPSAHARVDAPAPPAPPTTPITSPRPGASSDVGEAVPRGAPRRPAARRPRSPPGRARRGTASVVAACETTTTPPSLRRRDGGRSRRQVVPDHHQRRRRPGSQRRDRDRRRTSSWTPAPAARRARSSRSDGSRVRTSGCMATTLSERRGHRPERTDASCGQGSDNRLCTVCDPQAARAAAYRRAVSPAGGVRPPTMAPCPAPPRPSSISTRRSSRSRARLPSAALPGRRPDQPAGDAAQHLRPVPLPRRRRGPRPDGEDAALHVADVRRLGRRHRARDRRRHPAQHRRPDRLRRGRQPDRGAPRRRAGRRDRVHQRHRGRRARSAQMLGADRVVATRLEIVDGKYSGEIEYYAYAEEKARAIEQLAEELGYDLENMLRLQRLGHRRPDARGGRPRLTRSTPTRTCARSRSSATGRSSSSPGPSGCAAECPSRRPSRPWPRSRSVARWPPAASCGRTARKRRLET